MNKKWVKVLLEDAVIFETGNRNSQDYVTGGSYPFFICSKEILEHNEYDFDKEAVIMAGNNANAIFHLHYFKGKFAARQRTYIISPKHDNFSCRYFYYLLQYLQPYFRANSQGTTTKFLTIGTLKNTPINLPPEADQKAIAHILGTLDEKIELNKKSNETLEGIAKSLFKSWFIDFDPVKAKAEGRSTGLPDEINKLFPDSFEDSELCQIPSGWRFCLSSDLYKVSIGKTPPRKESWWFSKSTKDIPWISIKDMGNSSVYALETSEFLTEDAVNKFNVKVLPEETVIVSFKLTVGRVLITPTKMVTNEAIAHFISHKNLIPSSYSYFLFSNFDFRSLGSTSSIATAVNSKMLREMKILDPPYKLKQAFDQICTPLLQKIKRNLNESSAIEEIKDAILPKLISGQLGIIDAEKIIEEIGI